jgi:hypothetical protein
MQPIEVTANRCNQNLIPEYGGEVDTPLGVANTGDLVANTTDRAFLFESEGTVEHDHKGDNSTVSWQVGEPDGW